MAQAGASTRFESAFGTLNLSRYPTRRRELLQAWCAADRLLLAQAHESGFSPSTTLVINDDFDVSS